MTRREQAKRREAVELLLEAGHTPERITVMLGCSLNYVRKLATAYRQRSGWTAVEPRRQTAKAAQAERRQPWHPARDPKPEWLQRGRA